MKKKNGYTIVELVVLIGIMGIATLIILPQLSKAFYDERDEFYQADIRLYLRQAEKYGEANKEEIKNEEYKVVSIGDLVSAGYIGANNDGIVVDARDASSMNEVKIKLYYEAEEDKVYAELVS